MERDELTRLYEQLTGARPFDRDPCLSQEDQIERALRAHAGHGGHKGAPGADCPDCAREVEELRKAAQWFRANESAIYAEVRRRVASAETRPAQRRRVALEALRSATGETAREAKRLVDELLRAIDALVASSLASPVPAPVPGYRAARADEITAPLFDAKGRPVIDARGAPRSISFAVVLAQIDGEGRIDVKLSTRDPVPADAKVEVLLVAGETELVFPRVELHRDGLATLVARLDRRGAIRSIPAGALRCRVAVF